MNYLFSDIKTIQLEPAYRPGMIDCVKNPTIGGHVKLKTFGERLNWARRNHARITQTELRNQMEEKYQTSIGANYISELEKETAISVAIL